MYVHRNPLVYVHPVTYALVMRTYTHYPRPVPDHPKTPHRSIRVDDDLWSRLDAATSADGSDRGSVLRAFARWYVREAGAKLPARPPGVIYAFRETGTDKPWVGHQDALPSGTFKTATITPEIGNYAGRTLEVRYGPAHDDTLPAMRSSTTVNGNDRVYPSREIHAEWFEGQP